MYLAELVRAIEDNKFFSPVSVVFFLDKDMPLDVIWRAMARKVENVESNKWSHLKEITNYIIVNKPELAEQLFTEHLYEQRIAFLFAPTAAYLHEPYNDLLEKYIDEFFSSMITKYYKPKVDAIDFNILYIYEEYLNTGLTDFYKRIFGKKLVFPVFDTDFETTYNNLKNVKYVRYNHSTLRNFHFTFTPEQLKIEGKKPLNAVLRIKDEYLTFEFTTGGSKMYRLNKQYAFKNEVEIISQDGKTLLTLLKEIK